MFCECGTVIVLNPGELINKCRRCGTLIEEENILSFRLHQSKSLVTNKDAQDGEFEQVKMKRTCKQCNNDEMYFHTAQLRSADEGQTVFYECTKCGFKETTQS